MKPSPLRGLRVLELGQLIAGPYAGAILGWLGASVLKIEPPQGDPLRGWRTTVDGTSLWWRSLSRNKQVLRLDLRQEEDRERVRSLILEADVLIENFRPGRMEAWGLGPEVLQALHPELIFCRVSGYGQTGPQRDLPGYASVAEARGGLRYLTGTLDGQSVRSNLSLGDSVAGLHAALGVLAALLQRQRSGRGQVVDVSLLESVVQLLESALPEADRGVVRQPSGSTLTGVVPSGCWRAADGQQVVLGANGESLFGRLAEAMGRPEWIEDPRFQGNAARVQHREPLEEGIRAWVASQPAAEVIRRLEEARVPVAPVQSAADLLRDPQLLDRGVLRRFPLGEDSLLLPEWGPRLTETPGRTTHPGGEPQSWEEATGAWRRSAAAAEAPERLSETMEEMLLELRGRRARWQPGDPPLSWVVTDPDRGRGRSPGALWQERGQPRRSHPWRDWQRVAELLQGQLLTPRVLPGGRVLLRLEPLEGDWHAGAAPTGDPEKYGQGTDYAQRHRLEDPDFLDSLHQALRFLDPAPGGRALSLGCGRGEELSALASALERRGAPLSRGLGLDHSASILELARSERPEFQWRVGDARQLESLALGRFELVMALQLLQSPSLDGRGLLRELVQTTLAPGGGLILGLPNCRWRGGRRLGGARSRNYDHPELSVLIRELSYYRRYLHQHRFRTLITGQDTLILAARPPGRVAGGDS